jgi:pyruvate/2-oxoglutarate dehydrogenase complex dihydrolipoamide acyltransferase (E2) component
VAVDQSLITVESDKASMEIPSSHAGVVKALKVKLGDKVKQGSVVVVTMEAASASGLAVTPPVIAQRSEAIHNRSEATPDCLGPKSRSDI